MRYAPPMSPAPCCAVAARSNVAEIEAALREGRSLRSLAAAHAVPYSAIRAHKIHLERAAGTLRIATKSAPKPAPIEREPRTLLGETRRLQRRLSRLLRAAERGEEGIDYRAAAALAGQVRGALELQAKLLGELRSANAAADLASSPQWIELRDTLLDALIDIPGALEAVNAVLDGAGDKGAPLARSFRAALKVRQDESFAAAWEIVRRLLDARYPGAAEHVEAGLAAWEASGGAMPGSEARTVVHVHYPAGVEPLPG